MYLIVVATPLYPPEIGGPATYAKALLEGLPERGIEVELVKFSDVRHLPRFVRHYAYYRRIRRALGRADAVLALDPVSVGLPVCLAAWRAKKSFVVKVVGDYAWEQGRQRFGITESLDAFVKRSRVPFFVALLRRVETGVARRASCIIVPSAYLKDVVATWGSLTASGTSIPREKIEVIYNAVPIDAIGRVPEAVAKLPRPLVVTVGRLVPWKQVDGVIDAVAEVPEASLAIVGDGPLHASLFHRAQEKMPNRFVLTGALSHEDTLAVLASASVLVLNSSYEGLSHLLVEALSLGVPIVATKVGGNPEVITDGEDGLLVPSLDKAALLAALKRVLDDTELRTRLSVRAKESARRFAPAVMLDATAHVFKNL